MSVKRPYSLQSQLLLLCRAFGEFLRYLKTQNASFRDSRHSLHDTRTPTKTSKLHLNDATLIPSDQYIQHHQNPFSTGDQNTAQASNLTNFHFSLFQFPFSPRVTEFCIDKPLWFLSPEASPSQCDTTCTKTNRGCSCYKARERDREHNI